MSLFTRIVDWVTTPYTIWLILKDTAISPAVKWRAAIGFLLIFLYVISPFDIIPDFVPLSGWLDDIAVVPAGFALLRRFTPGIDIVEKRDTAQKGVRKALFWTVITLGTLALLAFGALSLLIYALVQLVSH